jgi:hypothetical protein
MSSSKVGTKSRLQQNDVRYFRSIQTNYRCFRFGTHGALVEVEVVADNTNTTAKEGISNNCSSGAHDEIGKERRAES